MICPYCTSESVERVGHQWLCNCCSRCWTALSKLDAAFLRVVGIAAG